ncbi:MAG: hypothetical protein II707_05300, partial [Spirochaetales bacterium]|nr:hypothetical protein [Spirochaetales bacterium]
VTVYVNEDGSGFGAAQTMFKQDFNNGYSMANYYYYSDAACDPEHELNTSMFDNDATVWVVKINP